MTNEFDGRVALRDLFDRIVMLPPEEHAAALDSSCSHDPTLRKDVERLLDAHACFGDAFDTELSASVTGVSGPVTEDAPSTLPHGTALGRYVITGLAGVGGMGEVYTARDTSLDRAVAIKVLHASLTRDPAARQRLEREARAAAALAHPHICRLLDVGRQDNLDYLVMEYLDGETLRARLQRGKLPLDEALTYGIQIADALAVAHRTGIVHRDVKPGNIMLSTGGAKLLDFGLAKHRQQAVDDTPTRVCPPLTRTGMVLGTIQYMAPEQLDGRGADERTDVFVFGAVLYEMLTGRRALGGATDASTIGNILHAEPAPASVVEPSIPRSLARLLGKCLVKDPAGRWQSMSEVQAELEAARDLLRSHTNSGGLNRPRSGRRVAQLMLAIGVLLLATLTFWGSRRVAPSDNAAPSVVRASVQRNLTRLTFDGGLQTDPTFSPDGRMVAYASDRGGNFDIWVQPVKGGNAVQVTKSPASDTQPSWSPDGSTIVFRSERDDGGLYLVPALGGTEQRVLDHGVYPSWSPDGKEVRFLSESFSNSPVRLNSVTVGRPESRREIMSAFAANGYWWWIAPHPDGRISFLGLHNRSGFGFFTVSSDGNVISSRIEQLQAPLAERAGRAWGNYEHRFEWNRDGTMLLLQTISDEGLRNLWRVQVNPTTLEWTSLERLTTGAGMDVAATFAPDGKNVAFSTQRISVRLWAFPFGTDGKPLVSKGRPLTEEGSAVLGSNVRGDGRAVLYNLGRPGASTTSTLWLSDFSSGRTELLGTDSLNPIWSPHDGQIAYLKASTNAETGQTMHAFAVRKPGGAERLIRPWAPARTETPSAWMTDGRAIVVATGALEIWPVSDAPSHTKPRVLLEVPGASLWQSRFSPNARWLSFSIFRPGQPSTSEIGVTTAEGPANRAWTRIPLENKWIDKPRWGADGRNLYFLASQGSFLNLWSIPFDAERGVPSGAAFAVARFTSPSFRISPAVVATEMDVSKDHAFLTIQTAAGNIWMLDNAHR